MALEKIGGRKFVLAILAVAVGTAVQIFSPHGVNESFVALLVGITAAFGASNAFVSSKAINASANEPTSLPEVVDLSPISERLDQIEALAAQADEKAETVAQGLAKVGEATENTSKLLKGLLTVSR